MERIRVDGRTLIKGEETGNDGPAMVLVPPLNFSPVEAQVYRSGCPLPFNHTFLEQLNLRTILWLALEDPPDSLVKFCDDYDVNFHVGDSQPSQEVVPPETLVEGLQLLLNKEVHPLLVCCGMGGHRTGALIGCLRKLQGWNLASVSEEYRRFTNNRGASRLLVELQVEQFDVTQVVLMGDPPQWLNI